jgi:hypothetical protein
MIAADSAIRKIFEINQFPTHLLRERYPHDRRHCNLAPISNCEVSVLEASAARPRGSPAFGSTVMKRAQSIWALIARAIAALEAADFVKL